jgi:hypothetical protein
MPANPINTIKVQVGNQLGPTVRNIAYGIKSLKSSTDLQYLGANTGDVIVYNSANNNFYVAPVTPVINDVDGGFF